MSDQPNVSQLPPPPVNQTHPAVHTDAKAAGSSGVSLTFQPQKYRHFNPVFIKADALCNRSDSFNVQPRADKIIIILINCDCDGGPVWFRSGWPGLCFQLVSLFWEPVCSEPHSPQEQLCPLQMNSLHVFTFWTFSVWTILCLYLHQTKWLRERNPTKGTLSLFNAICTRVSMISSLNSFALNVK